MSHHFMFSKNTSNVFKLHNTYYIILNNTQTKLLTFLNLKAIFKKTVFKYTCYNRYK